MQERLADVLETRGAEEALLGTRFLAGSELAVSGNYKQALVASDGNNMLLSEIPNIVSGEMWPSAYGRVLRNHLTET